MYWGGEGDIESTDKYIGGWNPPPPQADTHTLFRYTYAIQIHIHYSDTHTLFRYTYTYTIQIHIHYSDTHMLFRYTYAILC